MSRLLELLGFPPRKPQQDPAKDVMRLQMQAAQPAQVQQLTQHRNPLAMSLPPEKREYVGMYGLGRNVRGYNAPTERILWGEDPTKSVLIDADDQTKYNLAMEVIRGMNDVSDSDLYERVASGQQSRVSFVDTMAPESRQRDTAAHEMTHEALYSKPEAYGLSPQENEALVRTFDILFAEDPDTRAASSTYQRGELKMDEAQREKISDIYMKLMGNP